MKTSYGGDDFGDFGTSGCRIRTGVGSDGRRSKLGWGTRYGGSEPRRPTGSPMNLEGKSYDEIKAQCQREGRLFKDPDFPLVDAFLKLSPPL